MRVRVHEGKCKKKIEELSPRVQNMNEIDEMKEIVNKVKRIGGNGKDEEEMQIQISDIKEMLESTCHCNHVDHLIKHVDEFGHHNHGQY